MMWISCFTVEEPIRVFYIKSDENFNYIKLVIISDLTEFEISQKLKDYNYNLFEKTSSYRKDEFITKLVNL